jgi:hypothetical protein
MTAPHARSKPSWSVSFTLPRFAQRGHDAPLAMGPPICRGGFRGFGVVTRHVVVGVPAHGPELGFLAGAALGRKGAARAEAAAARRVDRRCWFHVERGGWRPGDAGFRRGDGGEQCPRVGMGRSAVECVARPDLAELAEIHHGDSVADVADDRQVVSDEQHRQRESSLAILDQVEDLRLDRHVERRDGLVADEDIGARHERPRDAAGITYLCGVPIVPALLEVVAGLGDEHWAPCVDKDEGEVAEFGYRLRQGRVFRRYIVKRIAIEPGEQATLDQGAWRHWIFVTNDHRRTAAELESEHRHKALVEAGMREPKSNYGLGTVRRHGFMANWAWLLLVCLAHNLCC